MKLTHFTGRPRNHDFVFMILSTMILLSFLSGADCSADEPITSKHWITGLFSPDRVKDLRLVVATRPDITLKEIDYKKSEAEFIYDATKVFPNAKPEQLVERFDNLLRGASGHTFGVKPLCTTPQEKLEFIEISVAGLDCKACCLAAYESIYRLDGVERATASFKDGLVTAWIHPTKTDRAKLEEALRKKGVAVTEPGSGGPTE